MARTTISGRSWELEVDQQWIDITSENPTPNERWTFTDDQGHEHAYDHGYPTLEWIVDAEHWCDGHEGIYNHDPHIAVDEAHYECLICRQRIEPKMDPAYTPKSMPGMRSAYLSGVRADGVKITLALTPEEFDELAANVESDDVARRLLNDAPQDRIVRSSFGSP